MKKKELITAREEYIELLRKELLGPGSEVSVPDEDHELISSPPERRYSMGILFPQNNKVNADNDETAQTDGSDTLAEGEPDLEFPSLDNEERGKKEKHIDSDADLDPEEDDLDETVSLASQNLPSSMGFTFFANGACDVIKGGLTFGTYHAAKVSECRLPYEVEDPDSVVIPSYASGYLYYDKEIRCMRLKENITSQQVRKMGENDSYPEHERYALDILYVLAAQSRNGHVRTPHKVSFTLSFAEKEYFESDEMQFEGAKIKITALRRKVSNHLYSVTIMAVNTGTESVRSENCIFQPVIRIETDKNTFVFADYSETVDYEYDNEEEQSIALQYRNKHVYGTGLGTSLSWAIAADGKGSIESNYFPQYEVPPMDFNMPKEYEIDSGVFSMKYLSDLNDFDKAEKIAKIKTVVDAYRKWIASLTEHLKTLNPKFTDIAKKNIAGCTEACDRMIHGIQTLESNDTAWNSFQLANRAMFMQRVHIKLQEKFAREKGSVYPGDKDVASILRTLDYHTADKIVEDYFSWRPFQLAFLLLSVDSIVDDTSPDRNVVDLIWFPTGGGKTEAYLGLTAFTIFYRRLMHGSEAEGTSVIMRYTLRLLAAQQFTRASTLICACEHIRRDCAAKRPKRPKYKIYPLGESEISIGLWLGGEHTPNKNKGGEKTAKAHLDALMKASGSSLRDAKDKHNKFQVLKCPWCGTKLTKDTERASQWGYAMNRGRSFYIHCTHDDCDFGLRLPIQVVDEELYSNPPTLLFGTVDKFALLPWNERVGAFFAVDSSNRAPDLIIQDELHLISGPLGTMVGLYETAIDTLCKTKGVPAKIIASTATIRRAKQQCAALYDRDVLQFPHPGLDAEDSFFARETTIDHTHDIYGRRYIGLMPAGKTKAMMQIRTLAALLQKMHAMELPDEIKDKYWTITAYFNSLKDLGKCSTLLEDDVKDFILGIARRFGKGASHRLIGRSDELTSRVSTTALNETLDKLEKTEYKSDPETGKTNTEYASNTLLATNMISVGIDVARLNVMVLVGQPKLTSEYIQASSRVGRSFPGVAFTLYDSTKSRDRSHYEQFLPYHEAFYKHVEPTGATPFSGPARDRALHGVIISLMRHLNPELSKDTDAANFTRTKYASSIERIREIILKRNSSVIQRLGLDVADDSDVISEEIDTCFARWESLAGCYESDHFYYGEKFMVNSPSEEDGRLLKAYNTAPGDNAIDTMTSMRNVDTTVAGTILVWEEIK